MLETLAILGVIGALAPPAAATDGDCGFVGTSAAAINAMNDRASEKDLQCLRQAVAERGDPANYQDWRSLSDAWAAMYWRTNGGARSIEKAIAVAGDRTRPGLDRALALNVLGQLGPDERPEREGALVAYRPFLRDEDADVRLAALGVNSALWDHAAIEELKILAWGDDPRARLTAYHLVAQYLEYGSDRPAMGDSTLSRSWRARHVIPFDAPGLVEWRSRRPEWRIEQTRLLTGKEPAPERDLSSKGIHPATPP
jgi:hypothetical protein